VIKTLAGALLLYSLTNGLNILNLGANLHGLIEGSGGGGSDDLHDRHQA